MWPRLALTQHTDLVVTNDRRLRREIARADPPAIEMSCSRHLRCQ